MSLPDPDTRHFETLDYAVFASLLSISTVVGIYYGFIAKKKQNTTEEYLLGGKQMQTTPVAISLIATSISGFALLGVPAEIYSQGGHYLLVFFSCLVLWWSIGFVFLPVFYDIQCFSVFSYMEQRFDKSVRVTSSILFGLCILFYVPVTIYIPALAFSQTTGINIHYVTPIACLVCMFYTSFGGVRAVVWTDTLQFLSMIGGIVLVIYLGLQETSLAVVWEAAVRGRRLDLK